MKMTVVMMIMMMMDLTVSGPTCKQLRGHVNGGSHYTAGHHGLWFAEAQVGDLCPVLLVQLEQSRH